MGGPAHACAGPGVATFPLSLQFCVAPVVRRIDVRSISLAAAASVTVGTGVRGPAYRHFGAVALPGLAICQLARLAPFAPYSGSIHPGSDDTDIELLGRFGIQVRVDE